MRVVLFLLLGVSMLAAGLVVASIFVPSTTTISEETRTNVTGSDQRLENTAADSSPRDPTPQTVPASYVPQNPGRSRVQLYYVVHVADLLSTEEWANGPPDMPMEEYADLHMRDHVEGTECALMKKELAATCQLDYFFMSPLGEGRFYVKADFKFDPKIDPELAAYKASPNKGNKTYPTYEKLYIEGTPAELLKMRKHTYAYGPKQCNVIKAQRAVCHVREVVMRFEPDASGRGINTHTHVDLRWGYDEDDE
ncbi:hypothetical protein SAMN05444358_10317 [Ruegeria halocynthiae]|uniref:Uncharacterized protein n=1 Tax=Ruegeria halocynthiae TaxID=985054 RepID=A0A1H2YXQ1_9RHOB|nr:hypothetical protein [Ruegeria halocynthiae]SDX09847.1 hypothetical protein SAMN05444358_10317 [Ruegeria halocynthiae]